MSETNETEGPKFLQPKKRFWQRKRNEGVDLRTEEPQGEALTAAKKPRFRLIRRSFRILSYTILILLGISAFILLIWQIDTRAVTHNRLRNETLVGVQVSSFNEDEIKQLLEKNNTAITTSNVVIHSGSSNASTSLNQLDLAVNNTATAYQAVRHYENKPLVEQFTSWGKNWFQEETIPLDLTDQGLFSERWSALGLQDNKPAIEPTISYEKSAFVVKDGQEGFGISPEAAKILVAEITTTQPSSATITPAPLIPRFTNADAEQVKNEAEDFDGSSVRAVAGEQRETINDTTYKKWFTAQPEDGKLILGFDRKKTIEGLQEIFSQAGENAVDAEFVVENGKITITPEESGTECCGPKSVSLLSDAVFDNESTNITLPLTVEVPEETTADLQKLGVIEEVGVWTTKHPAGQPRVTNIHKISDLVRGQYIEPGKTFSVNNFVGRRTAQKGFVVDHVIQDGKFAESIGGGISQFATTLFNAAFFAGLEIPEYQAHSIYIGRYPYGREATLSYPRPDLKIKNNTPYGILIWPEYTSTTVTVRLYSTKFVSGDQTGQTTSPSGACTRVRTERTRTYVSDGHTAKDYFIARYRPGEGVNC